MGIVGLSLGAAALTVVGLNLLTNKPLNRHPDAVGMAGAMLAVWFFSMWADALMSPPESKLLNPAVDVFLAGWTAAMWITRREAWKLWVLILLTIQGLSHVVYQTEFRADGVLWRYTLALNLTFLAELVAVGWPGGSCVAHYLRDRLRSHHHPHSSVGVR